MRKKSARTGESLIYIKNLVLSSHVNMLCYHPMLSSHVIISCYHPHVIILCYHLMLSSCDIIPMLSSHVVIIMLSIHVIIPCYHLDSHTVSKPHAKKICKNRRKPNFYNKKISCYHPMITSCVIIPCYHPM
jgi:hypothetical protein